VLEQGLAALIITDVYQQPGSLPMLQYTLTELFDRREKNTLTKKAYQDVGGVLGALTRKAEEVFSGLSEDEQDVAKTLFLRLVSVGEGADDTRRRAHYADLVALHPDTMPSVINVFGDARLLTFDRDSTTRETTVEVAHEAIIRHWSQLQIWLDEFRDDFRQFRLLRTALEQWLANEKDESYLLFGNRLDRFNEWRLATATNLGVDHQAFLDASNDYHQVQVDQEHLRNQQLRELRRAALTRLRQLVLVLMIGLVLVIIFLAMAIRQNRFASDERDNAESARQNELVARMTSDANAAIAQTQVFIADSKTAETESLLLGANARNAILNDNPDLAVALALEAVKIDPSSPEAYQVLTDIAYQPNTRLYLEGHTTAISAIAVDPDGKLMMSGAELSLTLDPNHVELLLLWDLETGELLKRFPSVMSSVRDVVISLDGSMAFSAHDDGTVIVWSLPDGVEIHRFETGADSVEALALDPDGQKLYMSEYSTRDDVALTTISTWDLATMTRDGAVATVEGYAFCKLVISPDGATVVATSKAVEDATDPLQVTAVIVVAWDVETGAERWRNVGGPQLVDKIPVAISHDSQTVLVAEFVSFRISFVNIETGEVLRRIDTRQSGGHISRISGIDISPDGKHIISASIGGAIVIWDYETGEDLARLTGHRDQVTDIHYLPFGNGAVSGSQDTVLRVWDLEFGANLRQFVGHTKPVNSVAFLPDGERAISASGDMEAAQSGTLTPTEGNQLILWDVGSGSPLRIFENQPFPIVSIAVSPDGETVLSGSFTGFGFGHMVLWDVDTGEVIRAYDISDVLSVITSVGFGPDGRTAATGTFSGNVQYWDLERGTILREFNQSEEPIITSIFSPDGRYILSTSSSGSSILWDIETGEEVQRFQGVGPMVRSAFSHDGRRVITPIANSDLIVWDVETGEEIRHLVGHMGGGISVKFLDDDRYAISAGSDQILILWDVETGEILQRFVGHTGTIFDVAASPDGRSAISASGDGTLILWNIQNRPVADLVEWIRANRYVPELSPSEREQYNIRD
jgi:WD40 repeat protein